MRKVFITATVINHDTEEDFHGWIDWNWSRTQLHENKEDVRASLELEDDEEALTEIENILGAVETADGVTFYALDSEMNHMTGEVWTYAAHLEHE